MAASSHAPSTSAPPRIRVRAPAFVFEGIPRYWDAGSAMRTHLANGVNLLFPAGERFFVRSVRAYLDRIADDPALVLQVQAFSGQEGRHAQAHERYFAVLRGQGYPVDTFLRVYEGFAFGVVERFSPPALCLAVTAACEHFTATLAEQAFTTPVFDDAHPTMRALLKWHAAEEIEHKTVAFDVLRKVAPGYALRMAGLALATSLLGGFWLAGAAALLAHDRVGWERLRREWRFVADHNPFGKQVFGRAIGAYVRPGFHPLDVDTYELGRSYLEAEGMA